MLSSHMEILGYRFGDRTRKHGVSQLWNWKLKERKNYEPKWNPMLELGFLRKGITGWKRESFLSPWGIIKLPKAGNRNLHFWRMNSKNSVSPHAEMDLGFSYIGVYQLELILQQACAFTNYYRQAGPFGIHQHPAAGRGIDVTSRLRLAKGLGSWCLLFKDSSPSENLTQPL